MARILTAGNETGAYQGDRFVAYFGPDTTSRNQRSSAVSEGGNAGLWSYYLTTDTGIAYDFEPEFPAGLSEVYIRMHLYAAGRSDGSWEFLDLATSAGDTMLRFGTVDCSVGSINGGRYYLAAFPATGTSQLVGNNSFCFRNHVWNTIEIRVKFAGSGGRIQMWGNNQLAIDWTGTLVGPSSETVFHRFRPTYDNITGGAASARYYDDIAINDTTGTINNGRIGEGYVLPMWPVGNGGTSDLTNAFNTSVDNFKFINKRASDNPSGIVGTSTPNDKDLYALPSLPNEFLGVNAVRVSARGVRNGPTITKAKMLLHPPSQAEINQPSGVGVGITLPIGGLDYFFSDFNENANTGQPFTKAELDGMEAGIQFIA